jgi:hypothetical protein
MKRPGGLPHRPFLFWRDVVLRFEKVGDGETARIG